MILLIDNYDSFVYNLARYVAELGFEYHVVRNDATDIKSIIELQPSHIILSPGPCAPDQAGITLDVIRSLHTQTPILGVCLGHQAIAQAFGAAITHAKQPMHGIRSLITHQQTGILRELDNPLSVARYHSLIVSQDNFPNEQLIINAWSDADEIMALQHRSYPVFGVQFHPESVLTQQGHTLIQNFLL